MLRHSLEIDAKHCRSLRWFSMSVVMSEGITFDFTWYLLIPKEQWKTNWERRCIVATWHTAIKAQTFVLFCCIRWIFVLFHLYFLCTFHVIFQLFVFWTYPLDIFCLDFRYVLKFWCKHFKPVSWIFCTHCKESIHILKTYRSQVFDLVYISYLC